MNDDIYPIDCEFSFSYGPGNSGWFGFIQADSIFNSKKMSLKGGWQDCRELFIHYWSYHKEKGSKFAFTTYGNGKQVALFIQEAEKRLGLSRKTKISGCIAYPNISIVDASPWWFENLMRLHFLTILLRCGINYKDDFDTALYSTSYSKNTKQAVEKFFQGFTNWAGYKSEPHDSLDGHSYPTEMTGKYGWYYFFAEIDENENLKKNLELMVK